MPNPNILVVCPPKQTYLMRNLEPIRDLANIENVHDMPGVEQYAPNAEIIAYSSVAGAAVPFRNVWKLATKIKWLHSFSAGVDGILFDELINSPVPMTNARGVFKRSLADFVVLGILYFYKRVRRLVENQRAHRWDDFMVDWLPGKVMGVVGYGEIGQECAKLVKGLGLKIYAVRRNPQLSNGDAIVDRLFGPDQLMDMLRECDVVLAAAPLTPATHHMLSDAQFAAMKNTAIVMNVGRGPVIDEPALIRALRHKHIGAAALDVFEKEPLSPESPLWDMENVLISPHCTDRTHDPDWLDLSAQLFVKNFHHYLKGEPLENVVDKKAGY